MAERRLGQDINAAELAENDRRLQLIRDVEHAWPYNAHLYNDDWSEIALRKRLEEPWQGLRSDRSYLLCPDGRSAEVNTDPNDIRVVARAMLPDSVTDCDRCVNRPPPLGLYIVLVAAPRHIVALALCGMCVADVDPDEAIRVEESS